MKQFRWNASKNQLLMLERDKSFEEIVFHIQNGGLLDDIVHPNTQDFSSQRIFIVVIDQYVYLAPYVESDDEIFLKTIIPSRKFTKLYLGVQDERP
ncbi:MAG: toxin [Pseudohongiella sp.]|nr:toxin [Pseudohongiella sp.]